MQKQKANTKFLFYFIFFLERALTSSARTNYNKKAGRTAAGAADWLSARLY